MSSTDCTTPDSLFYERCQDSWIFGLSQHELQNRVTAYLEEIKRYSYGRVLLLLSDPLDFLAAYMACCISKCPVFLGNPAWRDKERYQAKAIAHPHLIWTDVGLERQDNAPTRHEESGWIMIPTGGTSGQIKFTIHTWETLEAAVWGMHTFFFEPEARPIHSYCVLPLHHVSGLMQFMRSLLTGGNFALLSYQTLRQDISTAIHLTPNRDFFISLVPTQLSRLLEQGEAEQGETTIINWLSHFECILLGGAPAPPSLLQQARYHRLPIAPTYGMTETAAQVMTLKPAQFLAGQNAPSILPHVALDLVAQSPHIGQMQWSGPSVCYGYYPNFDPAQQFLTDDIAQINAQGEIQIRGRASRKIISGGENIYPEEIEATVIAMKEIEDICVFGMPDADWGEVAIAAYVTHDAALSEQDLILHTKASLASYKCPKVWWRSPAIPRNLQGKVDLARLKARYSASICNAEGTNRETND